MKTEREESENAANEEGAAKRLKLLDQSSPQLGFENPLLPLASYDEDDEEEEDDKRDGSGGRVVNNGRRAEQNGHNYYEEDDDDDEDDEESQVGQGQRSRSIEVRRDCPYLDTVNRQVFHSSKLEY